MGEEATGRGQRKGGYNLGVCMCVHTYTSMSVVGVPDMCVHICLCVTAWRACGVCMDVGS